MKIKDLLQKLWYWYCVESILIDAALIATILVLLATGAGFLLGL